MGYLEIEETPEFNVSCCLCGFALHTAEIAADISGEYTDFFEKGHGQIIGIYFCSECWTKFKETIDIDLSKAIARRRAYENQDLEDRGEVIKQEDHT